MKREKPFHNCAIVLQEILFVGEDKIIILSITLPSTINKVGLGQNVVFWGDFLAQNNISQQSLHTYNLNDTELS